MMNLREYLETRRQEILSQISLLKSELREIKLAEAALVNGVVQTVSSRQAEIGGKITIKDMILQVLSEQRKAKDAHEIIQLILEQFGEIIPRSSLSPQLSRLKHENKIDADGRLWSIVTNKEDSDGTSSESSIDDGGGIVRGSDFLIASPEGASPSTSRQPIQPATNREDDLPL